MTSVHIPLLEELSPTFNYMLRAILAQQHPDGYIQGDRGPDTTEYSQDTLSLTNYFVAALRACGYDRGRYLDGTIDWVLGELPESVEPVDKSGMNRFEILLQAQVTAEELEAHGLPPDYPQQMLRQLLDQREEPASYRIKDVTGWFANVWALKLLVMAQEAGLNKSRATRQIMKEDIRAILDDESHPTRRYHGVLGLALNLYYRLHGHLEPRHKRLLDELASANEKRQGLWNIRAELLEQLPDLKRYGFSANIGKNDRQSWREALVGTCHVIETLAPLRQESPGVAPALERAMAALFDIFGGDPHRILQSFQKDYDWTLIMCRLLVAGEAYGGPDFRRLLLSILVDGMPVEKNGWDREEVTQALLNSFEVSYDSEPNRLTLGLSGAQVLRVEPSFRIRSPRRFRESDTIHPPGFESVIVKYGPHEEIEAEYHNYKNELDDYLQGLFAPVQLTHRNRRHSFLLIQNLHGFVSLEEFLRDCRTQEINEAFSAALLARIEQLHRLPAAPPRPGKTGQVRRIYLDPLWRYTEVVFDLYHRHGATLLDGIEKAAVREATHNERSLRSAITSLYEQEEALNQFAPCAMHGDLHTRNIMLQAHPAETLIRFIDLEKFSREGDYAVDVGQLSVNLKLVSSNAVKQKKQPIAAIEEALIKRYEENARRIDDRYYPARLAAAKARARLRIANGLVKGAREMAGTRRAIARDMLIEALEHVRLARSDLEFALDRLGKL